MSSRCLLPGASLEASYCFTVLLYYRLPCVCVVFVVLKRLLQHHGCRSMYRPLKLLPEYLRTTLSFLCPRSHVLVCSLSLSIFSVLISLCSHLHSGSLVLFLQFSSPTYSFPQNSSHSLSLTLLSPITNNFTVNTIILPPTPPHPQQQHQQKQHMKISITTLLRSLQ